MIPAPGNLVSPAALDRWAPRYILRTRTAEWSLCWAIKWGKDLFVRWIVGGNLMEESVPRSSIVSLSPLR